MAKFGLALFLSAGALAFAMGCNPYDPDIGEVPFRCGTEDPPCPDGYVCDDTAEPKVCVREGTNIPDRVDGGPGQPDAGMFVCNDDSPLEVNNTIAEPTVTPIPDLRDDYELVGLAICPATDVDVFRLRVAQTGRTIQADINFNAGQGSLLLDILNAQGVSIRAGMAVNGNPNNVRAEVPNVPADTYYVQVQGTPGVQNNYSIYINTRDE